jgi:DNA-binding winged helix-turn-helix (wHTH) protein
MTSRAVDQAIYEFGPFRLDPTERLLVRDGQPVPLTPKAFDLLVYLVEHQGRLVEKQALLSALWPDTVVEEVNLAYNISALRKVLDGNVEGASMIQTVPTRGYRFVAPVDTSRPTTPTAGAIASRESFDQGGRLRAWTRGSRLLLLLVGMCAAATAVFFWVTRLHDRDTSSAAVAAPTLARLTANPREMSVTSAQISPDGRYLAYADPTGVQVRSIDIGETHRLPETKGMNVYGWSPDSAEVLASQCDHDDCSGWSISLIGQERRRTGAVWPVRDRVKVAPNGWLLRLADSGTLSVDPMNGAPVRRLADGLTGAANWSTDGKHVLFVKGHFTIESVPAEGGAPIEVFRAQRGQPIADVLEVSAGTVLIAMTPPNTAISTAGPDAVALWKFHTDETGIIRGSPQRLTFATEKVSDLSASRSGARVAFRGTSYQEDVYVASCDLRSGVMGVPWRFTQDDRNDVPFGWTPDSTTVFFTSTRNGPAHIFKQRLDSGVAEPFVTSPGNQVVARVTSDGRWVLYREWLPEEVRIMRVPLTGGTPELVVHNGFGDLQCAAHGRCVLIQFANDGTESIWSLDPLRGRDVELARIPAGGSASSWVLPNGDGFAYVVPRDKGPQNVVHLISFKGKPANDIVVQQATNLLSLDWLPGDSGFLTTDGGNLLLVSRSGAARVLWSPAPLRVWFTIPSPDEKHLAINVSSEQANVWMLSGF